jgi:trans-aconitate 2-methyltransferase
LRQPLAESPHRCYLITVPTWDASQYLRFDDQRTRPCRELAGRVAVAVAAPQRVIDLGCGPGNSTAVLAERWPTAQLTGLDSSPDMIAAARKSQPARDWQVGDIADWAAQSGETFDVVFSNAALQWVGDHGAVFPKLLNRVAPDGALAVQVPGNYDAPAHTVMRELSSSQKWRTHFPGGVREWHVHGLRFYYDTLSATGAALDFWETEYLHIMPDAAGIVEWYKGTGLRPFLDALPGPDERAAFCADYLEQIKRAYPPAPDGRVLFPFRRLFMIAVKVRS